MGEGSGAELPRHSREHELHARADRNVRLAVP